MYGESIKQRVLGGIVKVLYKISLKCNNKVFFQNPDDLIFFKDNKIIGDSTLTRIVNGSGVDLSHYYKCQVVTNPVTFLLIARLLKEKGIFEFAEVAKNLKTKYPETNYQIIGWEDNSPSSIKTKILEDIQKNGFIDFLGYKKDIRDYLASCSIYVLPSYREGTPRTVLEAMSMCRPIITTDAPGCRETVVHEKNGLLVPVKDQVSLANAMMKMLEKSDEKIETMARESFLIAKNKYEINKVNQSILDIMNL